MLYDYLAEFFVVGQTKSISKAANQLALSVSALSRHMHALEQGLGVSLLERNPLGAKGVTLTSDGQRIFCYASEMVEVMDSIKHYVEGNYSSANSLVSVYGISEYPTRIRNLKQAVGDYFAGIGQSAPELRFVSKDSLLSKTPEKAIEEGLIDLYITYPSYISELPEISDQCEVLPLYEIGFVAAMEPTHPLANKPYLQASDLNGATFRHPSERYREGYAFWIETKRILRQFNIRFQRITSQFHSPSDWCNDFEDTILILSETYREVESLRVFGKSIVPLSGMTGSSVGVFRKDNDLARRVAECAQSLDVQ